VPALHSLRYLNVVWRLELNDQSAREGDPAGTGRHLFARR
jgi:hypothetical protein